MTLIRDLISQGLQMLLVLLLAPLLTGFVRKLKAQLLRRQGPPLLQPYRDLMRLLRKDVVLAETASWLFRIIPYIIFAGTWVAASLVPTFATGLPLGSAADLIVIVALLGSARFMLALSAEVAFVPRGQDQFPGAEAVRRLELKVGRLRLRDRSEKQTGRQWNYCEQRRQKVAEA